MNQHICHKLSKGQPNTCLLFSGSDGRLYSLSFHPQPCLELPGTLVNIVRAISTKHAVALVPLSSSHVAMYGADPSEEGEREYVE